ncbi:MAG: TolC family protein [Deltaproteobacteria bacterium]|nr:TolC family protein [Deltaproteobacteria bacterium]
MAALLLTTGLAACIPDRPAHDSPSDELALAALSEGRLPPRGARAEGGGERIGQLEPGGMMELSRAALIRQVIARNPEIEARRQALRAARSRRVQVSALDDPELAYALAPLSIGGPTFGQSIQVSQRLPWPGKRSSLGQSAEFEADAASQDVHVTELDLALEASLLFDDYFLVDRSLEVNEYHQRLLRELKGIAESQLATGRASLQDPLQAEVEISRLVEQDAALRSDREAVVSSMNGLLHRGPSEPLPSPPMTQSLSLDEPPGEAELLHTALSERPELRGLLARERAAQFMARWATREYFPDFTLSAGYSTMFEPDMRFTLGVSAPIPLQRGRRGGALDEADARIAGVRAESARLIDRIRADVSVARHRVVQAIRIVKILESRTIPATKAQVDAARVDFAPARTSFLAVVQGERNLRDAQLARNAAIAELGRWRARLDRALGHVPFATTNQGDR